MGVVLEGVACRFFEESDLAKEEAEGVEPGEEDAGDDLANAFFAEPKIVSTDNGGVDEEHSFGRLVCQSPHLLLYEQGDICGVPCSIRTVLIDDQVRVWIITQTLAHLLSITTYYELSAIVRTPD